MAQPITWRNVNQPNQGAANALFSSSADRISQGINTLSNAASTYGNQLQSDIDEERQTNTDNLLARLQDVRTQEQYDALLDSGEFSSSALKGQNVDTNAILSRFNALDDEIRAEELDRLKYADAELARAQRPVRQQALLDLARGNFDAADKGATELQDGELAMRIKTARTDTKEKTRLANIENVTQGYLQMFREKPLDENLGTEPFKNYLGSMQKNGATVQEQMDGLAALREGIAAKGFGTQYQDEVQYLTAQENLLSAEEKLKKFDEANPYITAVGANSEMQKEMTKTVIPELQKIAPEHDYFGISNVEAEDIPGFLNKFVGKQYVVEDGKGVPLSSKDSKERKALSESDSVAIITPQMIYDAGQRAADRSFAYDTGIYKSGFEAALAEVVAQYDPRILKAERQVIASDVNKRKGELFSIQARTNRKSD